MTSYLGTHDLFGWGIVFTFGLNKSCQVIVNSNSDLCMSSLFVKSSRSNCEVCTTHSPSCSDLMTFVCNDIRDIRNIQGQGFLSPLMFDLGSLTDHSNAIIARFKNDYLCICQEKVEIDFNSNCCLLFLCWDSLGAVRAGIKVPARSALGGCPIFGCENN